VALETVIYWLEKGGGGKGRGEERSQVAETLLDLRNSRIYLPIYLYECGRQDRKCYAAGATKSGIILVEPEPKS
jgi:hypothetical protein